MLLVGSCPPPPHRPKTNRYRCPASSHASYYFRQITLADPNSWPGSSTKLSIVSHTTALAGLYSWPANKLSIVGHSALLVDFLQLAIFIFVTRKPLQLFIFINKYYDRTFQICANMSFIHIFAPATNHMYILYWPSVW